MRCPKCRRRGAIRQNINFKKFWFRFGGKKVVTSYCSVCDFRNVQSFDMTKDDWEIEILQRTNLEKKSRRINERAGGWR